MRFANYSVSFFMTFHLKYDLLILKIVVYGNDLVMRTFQVHCKIKGKRFDPIEWRTPWWNIVKYKNTTSQKVLYYILNKQKGIVLVLFTFWVFVESGYNGYETVLTIIFHIGLCNKFRYQSSVKGLSKQWVEFRKFWTNHENQHLCW